MPSDFEFEGYNDKPKPCPLNCPGMVNPTFNCNVGQCDVCKQFLNWNELLDSPPKDE